MSPSSPSHSTDSGVVTSPQCILEDEETSSESSSSNATISNEDFFVSTDNDYEDGPMDLSISSQLKKKQTPVVAPEPLEEKHPIHNGDYVASTEDLDVKPNPIVLSDGAQLPVTNGLGNRGLKKRRIVSDDKEKKFQRPAVTKPREDETKLKIKREIVVKIELPKEEIIENRNAVDVPPKIGTQLLEKYELGEGGDNENANEPGTSGAATTSESKSEEDSSKSSKRRVGTFKSKVN